MAGRKRSKIQRQALDRERSTTWLWPALVDPDFDDLEGCLQGLTLTQIRQPLPTEVMVGYESNTTSAYSSGRRLERRQWQREARLNDTMERFKAAWDLTMWRRNQYFYGLAERFDIAVLTYTKRMKKAEADKIKVERQLWLNKCRRCIPYNGHHTPNYWGVPWQVDPW